MPLGTSQEKNEIFFAAIYYWINLNPENATRNPQLSLKITFHFYKKKEKATPHRDSFFYYQVLKNQSSNKMSII